METQTPISLDETFRREAGKLVAALVRGHGFQNLELIEDSVQEAMLAALASWGRGGMPDNPAAWLQRVARNRLVDELRRRGSAAAPAESAADGVEGDPLPALRDDVPDEQLRMLFVCCDESLPVESQLVLACKLLCGFSTQEIARRLFTSDANVQKRLQRGRDRLKQLARPLTLPELPVLKARADSVRRVIYLLYNEGYHGAHAGPGDPARAVRGGAVSGAHAGRPPGGRRAGDLGVAGADVLSHRAPGLTRRQRGRSAAAGGAGSRALGSPADRARLRISGPLRQRRAVLPVSRRGGRRRRALHRPTFAETRWQEIIDLYEMLERIEPSPLHTLNRAIAIAQLRGPAAGLEVLHALKPPGWLLGYYLWDAVLGELERRAGNVNRARRHLERALAGAPSEPEKNLIRRRLLACG